MRLSSCDVTSGNVLERLVLFERKGWDRGRWVVHTDGAKRMAIPGLNFRKALVDTWWTVSPLLCTSMFRTQSYHLVRSPFLALKVFCSLGWGNFLWCNFYFRYARWTSKKMATTPATCSLSWWSTIFSRGIPKYCLCYMRLVALCLVLR